MSKTQINQIELKIETAKEMVQRRKDLDKLLTVPEFLSVIEEGYFKDEASRLVMYKASPAVAGDPKEQYSIDKRIDAIGFLRQYFIGIVAMGNQAEKTILDDEETRDALMNADLSED